MTVPDLSDAVWRRAGGGEDDEDAVEIAVVRGEKEGATTLYAMRDARNPDGPVLLFTPSEWEAFVAGVKDGEFDL